MLHESLPHWELPGERQRFEIFLKSGKLPGILKELGL